MAQESFTKIVNFIDQKIKYLVMMTKKGSTQIVCYHKFLMKWRLIYTKRDDVGGYIKSTSET